jgi:site-specific recombinase XerD
LVALVQETDLRAPAPRPEHTLGPVESDWDAAEVWLRSVARKSRSVTGVTVATYRFHLAKLRWYCENIRRVTPSRWSLQDVGAFKDFLADLPVEALCERNGKRYVGPGDAGYTPFRMQPAAGSRSDIERFVHAMFKAFHSTGYIRINPMALEGAGNRRSINARRAVDVNLYELVLETMAQEQVDKPAARQTNLRDRFILVALRELGLRASELVGSVMSAFQQIPDVRTKRHYWVFHVSKEVAKGGKERWVPVTRTLLKVLEDYRVAFGLAPQPEIDEKTALLLSPQTRTVKLGGRAVRSAADRRFFGAWQELTTRQYLYAIVKQRLKTTADLLRTDDPVLAVRLEQASPHWFRHTFAKAALLHGQSMREVASLLGHASMDTTMVYTNQDALDSVRAYERDNLKPASES